MFARFPLFGERALFFSSSFLAGTPPAGHDGFLGLGGRFLLPFSMTVC
jgi:hypothetical protein